MKKKNVALCIVVVLIAVYLGINIYASNVAQKKVDETIANFYNIASIQYESVSVNLIKMDVKISNVLIDPVSPIETDISDKITIDEIIIYDFIQQSSEIPISLSISFDGIKLNINQFGNMTKTLNKLGYSDEVNLNLNLDYDYNQEKKVLNIQNTGIEVDNAGEINVSFQMSNLNLAPDAIASIFFIFPHIMLDVAKIEYKDYSLINRLIKLKANEQNLTVLEFKDSLLTEIHQDIQQEEDVFVKKALIKIEDFIKTPNELSILISPPNPVSIGDILHIKNNIDYIQLLNLQVN